MCADRMLSTSFPGLFFLLKHWKCLANIACIAAGLVFHRFRLSATQAMHTRLKNWFMSKAE